MREPPHPVAPTYLVLRHKQGRLDVLVQREHVIAQNGVRGLLHTALITERVEQLQLGGVLLKTHLSASGVGGGGRGGQ